MQNTYLGTVEWGYHIDATGSTHPDPAAIRVVSMGTPSGSFMDAAGKWNTSQVQDGAGNNFNTVDLPTSRRATVDPATLDDRALLQRIRELTDQLMRMDRRSVDYHSRVNHAIGIHAGMATAGMLHIPVRTAMGIGRPFLSVSDPRRST